MYMLSCLSSIMYFLRQIYAWTTTTRTDKDSTQLTYINMSVTTFVFCSSSSLTDATTSAVDVLLVTLPVQQNVQEISFMLFTSLLTSTALFIRETVILQKPNYKLFTVSFISKTEILCKKIIRYFRVLYAIICEKF